MTCNGGGEVIQRFESVDKCAELNTLCHREPMELFCPVFNIVVNSD